MIAHTVALVASSVLVALVSSNLGVVYLVSAGALGAAFLAGTIRLGRNPSESASMRLLVSRSLHHSAVCCIDNRRVAVIDVVDATVGISVARPSPR